MSAKFDYYEAMMDLLKRPAPMRSSMRTAVLEHLVLGVPQVEAARKHNVSQPNLARLVRRVREIEAVVTRICDIRNEMNSGGA